MNDDLIRAKIHRAVDVHGASLQDDPYLAQRLLASTSRKEIPHMKKLSTGMIIAIVLMLLSVTAVAVGLTVEEMWQKAFKKMNTTGEIWNIGEPTERDLTLEAAAAIGRKAIQEKFGVPDEELDAMGFYPSYFQAEVDDGTAYPSEWRFLWSSRSNVNLDLDSLDHGPNGEYRVFMHGETGEIDVCIFYTNHFWDYAQRIWDVGNYDEVYRKYKQTDFYNQPDDVQAYWTQLLAEKGYETIPTDRKLHQLLRSAQLDLQAFCGLDQIADNSDPQVAAAWQALEDQLGLDADILRKYAYVATIPGWNTGYDDVCIHHSYELAWDMMNKGITPSPCELLFSYVNRLGLYMVSFEKGTTDVAAITHVTGSETGLDLQVRYESEGILARADWTADDLIAFDTAYTELIKAFDRMDAAGAVGIEKSIVMETVLLALGGDPRYLTNITPDYDVKQWFSDEGPHQSAYKPALSYDEVEAKYGANSLFWPLEVQYDQLRQYNIHYSLPRADELQQEDALQIALDAIQEKYGRNALDDLGEYVMGCSLTRETDDFDKEITRWTFYFTDDPEQQQNGWVVSFIGKNYEDYGSRCVTVELLAESGVG